MRKERKSTMKSVSDGRKLPERGHCVIALIGEQGLACEEKGKRS